MSNTFFDHSADFGRRHFLTLSAAAIAFATALPGISAAADFDQALVDAAKGEGTLNSIALPPDWANYGKMISTFEEKFGLKVNNQSPNASSAQELQAIRSTKGQSRAVDVVDVGSSFALAGTKEGLFEPYKVSTWDSIPAEMKDADGNWYGDYFGVISFVVNTNIVKNVPQSWSDLLKPEYKGQIALNGSPMGAAAAFSGVWAASLANGGSLDDIEPGIKFFAELSKSGNFIPVDATPATLQSGQTPIVIDWDYLNLGYQKQFASTTPLQVVIPSDGVFGNYYAQAISAFAANPSAAKLWEEFVYSDEGQLIYLEGFAHPARFNDMVERGVIPEELMNALPPAEPYQQVKFPNSDQSEKAQSTLQANWQNEVGN
ncbi:ABC transporter substrate-binding protein [Martelella endophytica]|uniref:ABC transporter substrate-binding protein n=1 Tax=Martelella endophytica TaxID=1486262 RepID=UPI0005F1B638|nr:extracellular solute-binding protein [Martelella endophytica]